MIRKNKFDIFRNYSLKYSVSLLLLSLLIVTCSDVKESNTDFKFVEDVSKLSLYENDALVFEYKKISNLDSAKYVRNNYIHPLMSVSGDTLTEDFPEDHPHHRGIFWAWHQIYIDTIRVSDGWVYKNFKSELASLKTIVTKDSAVIKTNLKWSSPIYKKGKPYLEETATITTYKLNNNTRKINFSIVLKALVNGVKIAGADNEKGYGGFSLRIKMPKGFQFISEQGKIEPVKFQVNAGSWMKFIIPFSKKRGVSLLVKENANIPNYPQPWILRQKGSMQNIVYPGKNLIDISISQPLRLSYSLFISK